ncbi:uncharacterized protein LOC128201357 [Galleria mellonella]|uniref:Uncharacterized protein LOC113511006 n=1 Tax=Galleria mellonella TaxID=7137 RepID=A0ABM3MRT6_GALME|nr:uncharacterized protein LOC113511006 [Galleria mellonella]XP_052752389.1 uncharacterized protein LOC128201002 [Galleria mellonella]XP_052754062.1 uncharacterized protein LOC128201357 [Galleria mellonella]
MWEEVAEALNSLGEGAFKDWKGWSNYWVDYKAKLKRRVAAVRLSQNRTGGGPSNVPPLDALEQKFLSILGAGFGSGLSNVQVDPFPNIPSTSGTALRSEPLDTDSDAVMIEITASESESRGDIHITTIDTQNTGTEELPHPQIEEVPTEAPPSRPTRRRPRQQRTVSMEAARNALIDVARSRLEEQRRQTAIMEQMLNTLNRIAESINRSSRTPEARNEGAPGS